MTNRTNAPQLDELRRRNTAFAAKLEPVVARLRELLPERNELARLTAEAYTAAEKAARIDEAGNAAWVASGEEQFALDSGGRAADEGTFDLLELARELDNPAARREYEDERFREYVAAHAATAPAAEEPVPEQAGGGWVPTTENIAQLRAEGHARELREYADGFRRAGTEAHGAAEGVFLSAPTAYGSGDDFAEEACHVDELLGRALLEVSVVAEEAIERLNKKASA